MKNLPSNREEFQRAYLEMFPDANFEKTSSGSHYKDPAVNLAYAAFNSAYKAFLHINTNAQGPFFIGKATDKGMQFSNKPHMHDKYDDAEKEAKRLSGIIDSKFLIFAQIKDLNTVRHYARSRKTPKVNLDTATFDNPKLIVNSDISIDKKHIDENIILDSFRVLVSEDFYNKIKEKLSNRYIWYKGVTSRMGSRALFKDVYFALFIIESEARTSYFELVNYYVSINSKKPQG